MVKAKGIATVYQPNGKYLLKDIKVLSTKFAFYATLNRYFLTGTAL